MNTPLAAGATYTTNVTLKFPTGVANGDYSLLVVPDGNNDVNELSEPNNVSPSRSRSAGRI